MPPLAVTMVLGAITTLWGIPVSVKAALDPREETDHLTNLGLGSMLGGLAVTALSALALELLDEDADEEILPDVELDAFIAAHNHRLREELALRLDPLTVQADTASTATSPGGLASLRRDVDRELLHLVGYVALTPTEIGATGEYGGSLIKGGGVIRGRELRVISDGELDAVIDPAWRTRVP